MSLPDCQSAIAIVTGSTLAFRWLSDGQRHYLVTLFAHFRAPGGDIDMVSMENVSCVADDFGNLVRVPQ
jgi:hypothetical protein